MSRELITAPALEPVTVAEAKSHMKVEHTDDDTLIAVYIKAARQRLETRTRRTFVTTTWKMHFDRFPKHLGVGDARRARRFIIECPPLQTVSSIKYWDTDGALQTLSTDYYLVDAASEPGEICQKYGYTWPATRALANAVGVEYVAGYGDEAADVPADIRVAVLLLAAHFYEHREAVADTAMVEIPLGIQWLTDPCRMREA